MCINIYIYTYKTTPAAKNVQGRLRYGQKPTWPAVTDAKQATC